MLYVYTIIYICLIYLNPKNIITTHLNNYLFCLRNYKKVHHTRPKNLNLFTIRFPLPAIASILHRISGFILFLLIPIALLALNFSLTDTGFGTLQEWFSGCCFKIFFWLLLIPFCYHLVAGIRHLLSDFHFGNTRAGGKRAAIVVFIVSSILVILAGIWLW